MCDRGDIHGLMTYGEVMFFVGLLYFMSVSNDKNTIVKKVNVYVHILMIVLMILYIRFANICYLKATLQQSQTISYFTTLVSQIKSTDGYTDETPVVFINERKISDKTFANNNYFSDIYLHPYRYRNLTNNYAWREFVQAWCGYSPITKDPEEYEDLLEVAGMPSYPDSGSIQLIDDVVIVKFAED